MTVLSRFVLRHKLAILILWLTVLGTGLAASSGLGGRLSQQVALPGVASYRANQQIHRLYGNGGDGYVEVVVVELPSGQSVTSSSGRELLTEAFGALGAIRGLRVVDYANTTDAAFLTSNPELTYGLAFTPYAGEQAPSLATMSSLPQRYRVRTGLI